MLSMKAKYGLRALASLAKEYGKGPLLISDISSRERIPKKFLEIILLDLKKKGFLPEQKRQGWRLLPQQGPIDDFSWTTDSGPGRSPGPSSLRKSNGLRTLRRMPR